MTLVGLVASTAVGVLAFAAGGAANATQNVAARTMIAGRLPAELHGRGYADYAAVMNTAVLCGYFIGGYLLTGGGRSGIAIVAAGCVTTVAAAAGLVRLFLHTAHDARRVPT
jgi:hypothetical protein